MPLFQAVDALPFDLSRQVVIPLGEDDDSLVGPGLVFAPALALTAGLDMSDLVSWRDCMFSAWVFKQTVFVLENVLFCLVFGWPRSSHDFLAIAV